MALSKEFRAWLDAVAAELSRRGWSVSVYAQEYETQVFAVPNLALIIAWNDKRGGRSRAVSDGTQDRYDSVTYASIVESSIVWTKADLDQQVKDFTEVRQPLAGGIATEKVLYQPPVDPPKAEVALTPKPAPDPTGSTTTDTISIRDQVLRASGNRTALTWDEWNYYYKRVTGSNAPAPEDRGYARDQNGVPVVNGKTQLSVDEWFTAAFPEMKPVPITPPIRVEPKRSLASIFLSLLRWILQGTSPSRA